MKTIRHIASVLLIAIMLMIPTVVYAFMNSHVPDTLEDAFILLGIQSLWILMIIKRDMI